MADQMKKYIVRYDRFGVEAYWVIEAENGRAARKETMRKMRKYVRADEIGYEVKQIRKAAINLAGKAELSAKYALMPRRLRHLPTDPPDGWDRSINYSPERKARYEIRVAKLARHRAEKLNRVPVWADLDRIAEIYRECPEGHHVDHAIPLQGKLVSGLHVADNLQYLPARENIQKSNIVYLDDVV